MAISLEIDYDRKEEEKEERKPPAAAAAPQVPSAPLPPPSAFFRAEDGWEINSDGEYFIDLCSDASQHGAQAAVAPPPPSPPPPGRGLDAADINRIHRAFEAVELLLRVHVHSAARTTVLLADRVTGLEGQLLGLGQQLRQLHTETQLAARQDHPASCECFSCLWLRYVPPHARRRRQSENRHGGCRTAQNHSHVYPIPYVSDTGDDSDDMPAEPCRYTVGVEWYAQKEGLYLAVMDAAWGIWKRLVVPEGIDRDVAFKACRSKWGLISEEVYRFYHVVIKPLDLKRWASQIKDHMVHISSNLGPVHRQDRNSIKASIFAQHPDVAAAAELKEVERRELIRQDSTATQMTSMQNVMAQMCVTLKRISARIEPVSDKEQRRNKMVKAYRRHLVDEQDQVRSAPRGKSKKSATEPPTTVPMSPLHRQVSQQAKRTMSDPTWTAASRARLLADGSMDSDSEYEWQEEDDGDEDNESDENALYDTDDMEEEVRQLVADTHTDDIAASATATAATGAVDADMDVVTVDDDDDNGKAEKENDYDSTIWEEDKPMATPAKKQKLHMNPTVSRRQLATANTGDLRDITNLTASTSPTVPSSANRNRSPPAPALFSKPVLASALSPASRSNSNVNRAGLVLSPPTRTSERSSSSSNAIDEQAAAGVAGVADTEKKAVGRPKGAKDRKPRKRQKGTRRELLEAEEQEEADAALHEMELEASKAAADREVATASSAFDLASINSSSSSSSPASAASSSNRRETRGMYRNNLPTTSAPGGWAAEAKSDLFAEIEERQRNPPAQSKKRKDKESRLQYNNRG